MNQGTRRSPNPPYFFSECNIYEYRAGFYKFSDDNFLYSIYNENDN